MTLLIDYLLGKDDGSIKVENSDANVDGTVGIDDVTCLIDYLLGGSWPSTAPKTETFTVNGVTFTMVTVEGGTFQMGATAEQGTTEPLDDEYPVHQVTLSTYSIGQTEVTQELWEAVMSTLDSMYYNDEEMYQKALHPCYFSAYNGFAENLQRPVENVRPGLIRTFLSRLNRLTGQKFRLPSEAEWEFAARGGNLSKGYKYAGSNDVDEVAWNNLFVVGGEDSPDFGTHTVATKKPNELGLYDMSGNVQEVCEDRYNIYPSEPQIDPWEYHGSGAKVARGGSWRRPSTASRVSCRSTEPMYGNWHSGFRLALGDAIVGN